MEVGQKVYLKPTIYARGGKSNEPQEYEIKSIGRKYFYVWKDGNENTVIKFDKDKLEQHNGGYVPVWKLYFSLQEIEDEKEFNSLHNEIERTFRYGGRDKLTLDQLRQIKRIIDGGERETE